MPASSLTFEQARHLVETHAAALRPAATETVALAGASSRILAEPLLADRDFPPFPRATRDGFALRAADVVRPPTTLRVIGEIKAGIAPAEFNFHLASGQAVSIMTGAPLPSSADAVVMVEHTEVEHTELVANEVKVLRSVAAGENYVPTGAEALRGAVLLHPGARLDAAAIACAASVGKPSLRVFRRPRIAVLSTGDELVDVHSLPGPTQIRNSNLHSLAAQISAAGADPVLLPIAPDEPARLRELIELGLQADLLLLTGGVSVGKYDLVEQVLAELHASFLFTSVQIQPGRPAVFGQARDRYDRYFFGLPGNPVSTMVTFELFARPMVEALCGMTPRKLVFARACLKSEVRTRTGLTRFLPASLTGEFDEAQVDLVHWQGSGDMAATVRANCYLVVAPDRELLSAGEWVPILMR